MASSTLAAADQRRLLVLGSSVAEGFNAEANFGWAQRMAKALASQGVQTENRAEAGTNTDFWQEYWQEKVTSEELASFDIVLMSLSLANEGLPCLETPEEMDALTDRYLEGYKAIVQALRRHLVKPGARMVVGCPYPNEDYEEAHLVRLERVRDTVRSWPEVDYAIDFLQPPVHRGSGRWRAGLASDAGHPNDEGHAQMLACVDLNKVLGK
mmetsp:Transcript_137447/g.342871  ORF Transcript_137447/g.342871 Transcript_137447/m.342871 type:complete len:211 (-) Transcript_137447:96-728(-)